MARPGFMRHRKFRQLRRLLPRERISHLRGHVEMLWETAYDAKDARIGDEADVERESDWCGKPGEFANAMLEVGLLDLENGEYVVHDLDENAPDYVRKRLKRRTDGGQTADERRTLSAERRPSGPLLSSPVQYSPFRAGDGAENPPTVGPESVTAINGIPPLPEGVTLDDEVGEGPFHALTRQLAADLDRRRGKALPVSKRADSSIRRLQAQADRTEIWELWKWYAETWGKKAELYWFAERYSELAVQYANREEVRR